MEKKDNYKNGETKSTKKSKILFHHESDEPGIWEFGTFWGPGDPYKPWIYGK